MVLTDEEQPLLRIISHDYESVQQENDAEEAGYDALDFEPLDPEDPRNWSPGFKWGIVLLLALMAFTVYAYSPSAPIVKRTSTLTMSTEPLLALAWYRSPARSSRISMGSNRALQTARSS